jgi:hypothetical protein
MFVPAAYGATVFPQKKVVAVLLFLIPEDEQASPAALTFGKEENHPPSLFCRRFPKQHFQHVMWPLEDWPR